MNPGLLHAIVTGVQLVDTLVQAAQAAGHADAEKVAKETWDSLRSRRQRLQARMQELGGDD